MRGLFHTPSQRFKNHHTRGEEDLGRQKSRKTRVKLSSAHARPAAFMNSVALEVCMCKGWGHQLTPLDQEPLAVDYILGRASFL